MSTPFLWHNGRIKPWAEANVHVSAHALHYGSSVFEGERVYATPEGPAYFRLADHTRRLFESARVYEIDIGYSERDINEACLEVIRANRMASAYVRPIVFRGAGGLGVLPRAGAPVDVAILALEWGAYLGDAAEVGADVCVSSWHRPAPNTIPSWAKAGGNYLSSQLIGLEARRGGYDEGIALGTNGLLSEPVPGQARQAAHATIECRHSFWHYARYRHHPGRRIWHCGRRTRPAARSAVHRR
jgi:branched-chain amino acid aminotransferase